MPAENEQLPLPDFPKSDQAAYEISSAAEAALRLAPDLALPEAERRKLAADLARYDQEFDRVDKNSPSIEITRERLAAEGIFHPLEQARQQAEEIEAQEVSEISERAKLAKPRPKKDRRHLSPKEKRIADEPPEHVVRELRGEE